MKVASMFEGEISPFRWPLKTSNHGGEGARETSPRLDPVVGAYNTTCSGSSYSESNSAHTYHRLLIKQHVRARSSQAPTPAEIRIMTIFIQVPPGERLG